MDKDGGDDGGEQNGLSGRGQNSGGGHRQRLC